MDKYYPFAPFYSVRKHFEASGYADAIDAVLEPRREKCRADFSDIAQNNVFLLLTALMRNFYAYLVALCAALKDSPIQLGTRMKNFIFHFMTLVGQWARHARQNALSVYTDAPAWFAPLLL